MKKIALMMVVAFCGLMTANAFAADNSVRLIDPPVKHHKVVHKRHHAKKHLTKLAPKKVVAPAMK